MEARNLAPGEYLIQCPYNVSHMILNKKQITHLDKCRKQYEKNEAANGRKPEIVPCRFNFSHRIIKPEVRLHEQQCPDQYTVVHSLVQSQDVKPGGFLEANRVKREYDTEGGAATSSSNATGATDSIEDWDADATMGTEASGGYDPSIKLNEGTFLYMKPGMTKSERRAAREENRRKWLAEQEKKERAKLAGYDSDDWYEDDCDNIPDSNN